MSEIVEEGQYIVVKRRDFTKLVKVATQESNIQLGKDVVNLKEVLGQKYFETFKMKFSEQRGRQRMYTLEACSHDEVTD